MLRGTLYYAVQKFSFILSELMSEREKSGLLYENSGGYKANRQSLSLRTFA
jgi:hypothetical protein